MQRLLSKPKASQIHELNSGAEVPDSPWKLVVRSTAASFFNIHATMAPVQKSGFRVGFRRTASAPAFLPAEGWPQGRVEAIQIGTRPQCCSETRFSDRNTSLSGDVQNLLAYHWHMTQHAEWADVHPCFGSHRHMSHLMIPLRFHGDDASIKSIHGRKLFIMSIHGEFSPPDANSRLLSVVLHDDSLVKGSTIKEIMRVWRWSWDCLFSGTYPLLDHEGQPWDVGSDRARRAGLPLAAGWRFVFAGSLGDWAFFSRFRSVALEDAPAELTSGSRREIYRPDPTIYSPRPIRGPLAPQSNR